MQLQDHRPRRGANHRDLFKEAGEKRPPQPRAGAGEAAQAPEAKRKAAQPGVKRTCAVSQVPSDGEATVNEEKVAQAARWDGIHTIIAWGNDQLSTTELLHQCTSKRISHQQARSEDPTDLSLDKPAHPLICCTYCCVQHIDRLQVLLGISVERQSR